MLSGQDSGVSVPVDCELLGSVSVASDLALSGGLFSYMGAHQPLSVSAWIQTNQLGRLPVVSSVRGALYEHEGFSVRALAQLYH